MADLVVRPARLVDRAAVLPLAQDLATSYAVDPMAYPAIFDQLVADPDALLLVAERDGTLVGYLLAQQHHTFHANGTVVWVEEVLVAAELRAHGVGRALMESAEEWGRSIGASYMALATRRAAAFYESLGYAPSATYFKRTL